MAFSQNKVGNLVTYSTALGLRNPLSQTHKTNHHLRFISNLFPPGLEAVKFNTFSFMLQLLGVASKPYQTMLKILVLLVLLCVLSSAEAK